MTAEIASSFIPPSDVDYHARPEFSSSQIPMFIEDPIKWHHYFQACDWPKEKPTEAMKFGTAIHTMCETGDYSSLCRTVPNEVLNADGHRKGKAYTEWAKANPADVYLKQGELNPFAVIWEHLNAKREIREWLACPRKEFSIVPWEHKQSGIQCRAKIDVLPRGMIIDWKTTSAVGHKEFQDEICYRQYDLRLAFYRLAVYQEFGELWPVVVVAIKNSPGFAVQPYEIPKDWLDDATEELHRVMERVASFDIAAALNPDIVELRKPAWRFNSRYTLEQR